ncbi:PAS domain S-box protein [Halomicroarcula sp. GCM10025710]
MQKGTGTDTYEVLANRVKNAVEQYRTEQQFWSALSWYQRLVEQELTGVCIVQGGEFVYVNQKLAEILGYGQDELVGQPPRSSSLPTRQTFWSSSARPTENGRTRSRPTVRLSARTANRGPSKSPAGPSSTTATRPGSASSGNWTTSDGPQSLTITLISSRSSIAR